MTESTLRQNVNRLLRKMHRDPISIENSAYPGTPDVNYADGWIELKSLDRWPPRESSIVRPHHLTQQQKVWLRRRWRISHNAWLLLSVGREWLLFDGETAFHKVGSSSRSDLIEVAFFTWMRQPSAEEFVEILDQGRQNVETI